MKNLLKNVLVLAFLMAPLTAFADDQVTVTSYAPAPEGDYQNLRVVNNANLAIESTGKVGIGTTNPQAKLDVRGTFKLVDGSQGQDKVLTSNADGVASWQPGVVTVFEEIICKNGKGKDLIVICNLGDITEWKACYLTAVTPITSSGSWDAGCVILGENGTGVTSIYTSDRDRDTSKWQVGTKADGKDGVYCAARCIK